MRKKMILFLILINVISAIAISNPHVIAETTSWPIAHANNHMTGATDSGPMGNNIKQLWQYSVMPPIITSPIMAEGKLYFSSCARYAKDDKYNIASLVCLDAETGAKIWENKLNGWGLPFGSPSYEGGNIFIGTTSHVKEADEKTFKDQYMYCLDAKTGKEKWSFCTEGPVITGATPQNGSLYFSVFTYKQSFELFKLEIATGRRLWSQILPDFVASDSITADDDMIFFTCGDGMVYAIETLKGKILWKTKITSTQKLLSCVIVDGNNLYAGSYDNNLYCLERKTGVVKWKFDARFPIMCTPALSENKLVFATFDEEKFKQGEYGRSKLICVNTDGKKLWETDAEFGSQSSPSISNGKIYAYYGSGNLAVLNLKDGSSIYKEKINTLSTCSPAIAEGKVAFVDWDGVVRCYAESVLEPKEIDFAEIEPGSTEKIEAKISNTSGVETTYKISDKNGSWYSIDRTEIKVRPGSEATVTFSINPERYKPGEILKGDFQLSFGSRKTKVYVTANIKNIDSSQSCPAWGMSGANSSHSNFMPASCGPVSSSMLLKWKAPLEKDNAITTTICSFDDKLFVSESSVLKGSVSCLTQSTGRRIWSTKVEGVSDTSIATNGKMVYVGNDMGLKSLDANSGFEKWSFRTKYSKDGMVKFHPKPILVGNKVIFGAADSYCYTLDSETGRKIWDFKLDGSVMMSPCASGKMVFVGSSSSQTLFGLDIRTGYSLWDTKLDGNLDAYPSYANEKVFISTALGQFENDSTKGKVHCLDAMTGKILWSKETKARINSSITIAGANIYFGSKDGSVYALSTDTGESLWSFATSGKILSSPVFCKEMLFVTSMDGFLYVVSSYNGKLLSKFNLDAECIHTPVVANGLVFTLNGKRELTCHSEDPDSEPTSIKVYYPTSIVEVGQKIQIQTEMTDKKGEKVMGFKLNWEVEPSDIGKIDQYGVFEALSVGQCKITASYSSISSSMELEVVEKLLPIFDKVIDFGTVAENEEKQAQFNIKNLSFKPVTVSLKTEADWFRIEGETSFDIAPGTTKKVDIVLVAANITAGSRKQSKIQIEWPDGSGTVNVKMVCKGLQFSRENFDFGEVQSGSAPEKTLVISNSSSLRFTVKSSVKAKWLIIEPQTQDIEPGDDGIFKIKIDTLQTEAQKTLESEAIFDWTTGSMALPVKVFVVGDNTPPALIVDAIPELLNAETATVTGSTEKGASVTVNGKPATVTGDRFKAEIKLQSAPSRTQIKVLAQDKSGNKTEVKREAINVFKTIIAMKIGSDKMHIFGKEMPINPPPMVIKGSTFVPLRSVGDAFGASIDYNAQKKEITISLWEKIILLTIGSDMAVINGNEVQVKPPPQIVSGKTMVPLRFIAEAFGAQVEYEASSKTITITLEKRP